MSTPLSSSSLIESVFNPEPVTRTTLADLLKEVEGIKAREEANKPVYPSLATLKEQARIAIYAYLKAKVKKGDQVLAEYTGYEVTLSTQASGLGAWDGIGSMITLTRRSHNQFVRHFDAWLRTQDWYQYCESHTFGGQDGVISMGVAFGRKYQYSK